MEWIYKLYVYTYIANAVLKTTAPLVFISACGQIEGEIQHMHVQILII